MTLSKSYDPALFEERLYQFWEDSGFFKHGVGAKDQAEPYSILLPPPNVTGTLHMGHAFQHTLMDALIRYHRMQGFDVLWQAGTDHAGIATQLVVERQLEQQGIDKNQIGREKFLTKVWQWKENSGNTITKQMRRIGSSCDWSREKFTMDDELSQTVTEVFVKLYQEGLIYRGQRLVNWDPNLKTAVSDLEVEMIEQNGFIWHILYPFSDGEQKDYLGNPIKGLAIATTRPETMLADSALAVNPNDQRFLHLVGKFVDLPLCNRKIPIIADDIVDPEFGSGCVKITGAHDFNDYQCSLRHNLELISILDESAILNENAPKPYQGLDRNLARQKVVDDLTAGNFLIKSEKYQNKVPICTRTGEIVEPMLTNQWFVKMDELAKIGLHAVEKNEVSFVPANWLNIYQQWLENIQDWCISRQLWWGHRIPAWYDEQGNCYVANTFEQAQKQAGDNKITQDEDVLDTWFSSALWPFSTLEWQSEQNISENKILSKYLPTKVLITGFDIIFFWVARMVMMTKHIVNLSPFNQVHITGLVRDAEGQKMSKSKGNIIDPIDLMDGISLNDLIAKRTTGLMQTHLQTKIENDTRKHFADGITAVGADALRFTFAALASHGRDIKFDHHRCLGYRNFCTKLWNATRFVLMQLEDHDFSKYENINQQNLSLSEQYILNQLQFTKQECAEHFRNFRFDLLAKSVFETIWHDFCDWYLEMVKYDLKNNEAEQANNIKHRTAIFLEELLRLAHPLIPFITEELWQNLAPRIGIKSPSIMLEAYPKFQPNLINNEANEQMTLLKAMVEEIRRIKSTINIPANQKIPLLIYGENKYLSKVEPYLITLAKLSNIERPAELAKDPKISSVIGGLQLMLKIEIDQTVERTRLTKELDNLSNEYQRNQNQLSNQKFIERAPNDVIERIKNRQQELITKTNLIKNSLEQFIN